MSFTGKNMALLCLILHPAKWLSPVLGGMLPRSYRQSAANLQGLELGGPSGMSCPSTGLAEPALVGPSWWDC